MSARPFIKWVGGKGRLLPQLRPLLPEGAADGVYFEPFLGGGAMFFDLAPKGMSVLSDANEHLVNLYACVRVRVEDVIDRLHALESGGHDRATYYQARERFNTVGDPVLRAALFIYLNKTCFNGLYRVNRKGEFNVSHGRHRRGRPTILDEDALRAASCALEKSMFLSVDFEAVMRLAMSDDFVYLDPPYEPASRTANFTSYTAGGFSQDDQRRLRDACVDLDRRGARFMMSNSDVPFVRELYADFRIHEVQARRAINADGSKRGPVGEVVVTNYEPVGATVAGETAAA